MPAKRFTHLVLILMIPIICGADRGVPAVLGVGLKQLDCWDREFESR